MSTSKTLRVIKRKLPVRVSEYEIAMSELLGWDYPTPDMLDPGWDEGIDMVMASLDAKTLTLAYYERS